MVTAVMAVAISSPVMAQDTTSKAQKRQQDKNNMRNLGTGLGAAGAAAVLKGKTGTGLVLGAGAALAAKKYDDQRKAQQRSEAAARNARGGYPTARAIEVLVNKEPVHFTDSRATMIGSRVYVPVRGVLERMGAGVRWDAATRTVVATKGDRDVVLPINSYTAKVDNKAVALDAPARIINGRTMVPLRFLSEAFGANVAWDAADRQVNISS